jgi:hypothetical protein
MEFSTTTEKSARLVQICRDLEADVYLSGPSAKDYLDVELFRQNGIAVQWADYADFPVYGQQYPPFEHGVSIIDLLFNEGYNAVNYLKHTL